MNLGKIQTKYKHAALTESTFNDLLLDYKNRAAFLQSTYRDEYQTQTKWNHIMHHDDIIVELNLLMNKFPKEIQMTHHKERFAEYGAACPDDEFTIAGFNAKYSLKMKTPLVYAMLCDELTAKISWLSRYYQGNPKEWVNHVDTDPVIIAIRQFKTKFPDHVVDKFPYGSAQVAASSDTYLEPKDLVVAESDGLSNSSSKPKFEISIKANCIPNGSHVRYDNVDWVLQRTVESTMAMKIYSRGTVFLIKPNQVLSIPESITLTWLDARDCRTLTKILGL